MPIETEVGGIAADRLRSIVERIESQEQERKELAENIKEIYVESKSAGFDPKVIRQIIALRKKNPSELSEQEMLLDLYKQALGMTQTELPFENRGTEVVALEARA